MRGWIANTSLKQQISVFQEQEFRDKDGFADDCLHRHAVAVQPKTGWFGPTPKMGERVSLSLTPGRLLFGEPTAAIGCNKSLNRCQQSCEGTT
jgi:hypothetical protein